jgi:hypothetical protein
MSGFVKIWTDILHDSWVQGLTLSEKGLWVWLLTMAKEAGDSGQVSCPSWRGLGVMCGCDGKTAERILRKFHGEKRVTLQENENGTIAIAIPNYHYYQLLKRPGRCESRAEKSNQIPQEEPSQSRSDQIRADKTIPNQTSLEQSKPEQIRSEQKPESGSSAQSVSGQWSITPEAHETILNRYFKRFKTHLNETDLKTLLYGNHSFAGFGSGSLLLFALNNMRVGNPETVANPVGLLIDFHANSEKYLSDNAYSNWKQLNYSRQVATGNAPQSAVHAGEIIKRIMSNLAQEKVAK